MLRLRLPFSPVTTTQLMRKDHLCAATRSTSQNCGAREQLARANCVVIAAWDANKVMQDIGVYLLPL